MKTAEETKVLIALAAAGAVVIVIAVYLIIVAPPACVALNAPESQRDPDWAWSVRWVPERVCEEECGTECDFDGCESECETECWYHPTRGRDMMCPVAERSD